MSPYLLTLSWSLLYVLVAIKCLIYDGVAESPKLIKLRLADYSNRESY
jgi:hypothetical protein